MNDAINMDDLTAAIRAASDLRLQESYDRLLMQAETTARLRADLLETARKIDSVLTKINDEQLRRKMAKD